MPSPNLQSTRALISVAVRRHNPQAEADARRVHAVAVLEKSIREVLAMAPPLNASQKDHLASLLSGGATL